MRYLLDTHAFIWWDSDPARLSDRALAICQDRANRLYLSVASVWEMQMKLQLGKLGLHLPLSELIDGQQRTNGIETIPVDLAHVLALDSLPAHHRDPFDRLLAAQALIEKLTLISGDTALTRYPVEVIW